MGFDAGEIDVLDYDFSKFVPGVMGVTPEPSKAKIQEFQRAVKAATKDLLIENARQAEGRDPNAPLTAAELATALSDENDAEQMKVLDAVIEAVGAVCSNQPSAAEIQALPWRIQQHFLGYIMGKFSGKTSALV